eukprot:gene9168-10867_t
MGHSNNIVYRMVTQPPLIVLDVFAQRKSSVILQATETGFSYENTCISRNSCVGTFTPSKREKCSSWIVDAKFVTVLLADPSFERAPLEIAPFGRASVVTFAHLRAGVSSDVDEEADPLVQTASSEYSLNLGVTLALLGRAARVYTVAGKMFWDYRSVRQQAQRQRVALGLPAETPTGEREPPQVELLWEGAHTRGAARMLAAINDLQGFWVKVHEGRLATGQRVAIKVQHKNVAERMVQDLENLRVLTELLHRFESDADYRTVVGEWATEVIRELDFRTEAANLAEVKANLAATSVTAIVPTAFPEMVTRRVLVMEFCEGVSVRDSARLDAMGVDRRVLMDRICEAFADQIHRHGFFNGDPHPGNLHVSTDPAQNCGDPSVPVLLDFGLTKRFEPDMKVAFARMVYSSSVADVDGLITGFREMGLKFKEDPFEDLRNTQSLFRAVPKSK